MTLYPHGTAWVISSSSYSWVGNPPAAPDCIDGRWEYATISICGVTYMVGKDDFNCGFTFGHTPTEEETHECSCCEGLNGHQIKITWSIIPSGDVVITIQ